LRYGSYPAALTDLVHVGLLRHLPVDPFAPTFDVPLHYRPLAGDKFLLYSVGADGIDDNGRPVDLRQGEPTYRYWPNRDDKGDWVYGVDTPHT